METRTPGLAAGPVHTESGYVDSATAKKIADAQAKTRAHAAGRRWGIWIEAQVVDPGWITPESVDAAAAEVDTTQHPRGAWWTEKKSIADRKAAALRKRLDGPAEVRELPPS